MGKSTISMAMFNSYVCLPEGKPQANSGVFFQNDQSQKPHRLKFPVETCAHLGMAAGCCGLFSNMTEKSHLAGHSWDPIVTSRRSEIPHCPIVFGNLTFPKGPLGRSSC